MFTNENVVFCCGQTQTVQLPDDFFLVTVLSEYSWRHHYYLGILYFDP